MKGFHLTIDSWHPGRTSEGWLRKYIEEESSSEEEQEMEQDDDPMQSAPATVRAVPRFLDDLRCLEALFGSDHPPKRYVCSKQLSSVSYGFGDASGSGFGAMYVLGTDVVVHQGVWGSDVDSSSPNFRELSNLVLTLEEGARRGDFDRTEVWIFTDNTRAESVFHKGHSPSPKLNSLALRLRLLEIRGQTKIHMVHVAGDRMVRQGTDGLSRGDLTGIPLGAEALIHQVPLNLSALQRRSELIPWLRSWIPSQDILVLEPQYTKGHGILGGSVNEDGIWLPTEVNTGWLIWHPPPALAMDAVYELGISRHKRKGLNHIFIVPRLMTYEWRKALEKTSDYVLSIPHGSRSFWPTSEFEPLIIGLTLRFSTSSPWQVKCSGCLLGLAGKLRSVWTTPEGTERAILRELCLSPAFVGTM